MAAGMVRLGANWYFLARDERGTPLYKQVPLEFFPPQSALEELTEAQFPPEGRQPYTFRDLSGGAGQSDVPISGPNRRYSRIGDQEGEGVDPTLTPEGPVILAAELATNSPGNNSQDQLRGPPLWQGGSNLAYFGMAQYVMSWNGTTFTTLVGNLSGGVTSIGGIVSFRGTGTVDTWYMPNNSGGVLGVLRYSQDSGATTWLTVTTAGFPGGIGKVQSLIVIDGEVVFAGTSPRAGAALVGSFDNGGSAPVTYGIIDPVGDPSFAITRLMAFAGRVVVLKSGEGVFVLTSNRRTLAAEIAPELRGATIYATGATVWQKVLWLPTSIGLYAILPNLQSIPVGPERNETRRVAGSLGLVTALAGDATHLYAFRDPSSTTVASWLLKGVPRYESGLVSHIVWHDFLQLGNGRQCASAAVLSPGGNGSKLLFDYFNSAASGAARDVGILRLPLWGGDPRADSTYRYCGAGTLYQSRLAARFPAVNKTFTGLTPHCESLVLHVDGQTATTAQSVQNRWKLESTALTALAPYGYTVGATQNTGSGTRDPVALRGRALDSAIRLFSSDPTTTPQVSALTIDFDVEPSTLYQHTMTLDLSEGGIADSGVTSGGDPATPGKALQVLRALPSSGTITLVDPWNAIYTVTVPLRGVTVRAAGPREESSSKEVPLLVDVVALEQVSLAVGTYARLTLETYTSLRHAPNVFLYSQLPNF